MTTFYSAEATGYANPATVPTVMADGGVVGGTLRRYRGTITLAAQTTADTIVVARVPRGATFAFGVLTSTVSLGTTTVAIGITGTTGKYRAAAVFTAVDTPTFFGPASIMGATAGLTAEETIFLTLAVASLPGAGTLVVDLYFSGT